MLSISVSFIFWFKFSCYLLHFFFLYIGLILSIKPMSEYVPFTTKTITTQSYVLSFIYSKCSVHVFVSFPNFKQDGVHQNQHHCFCSCIFDIVSHYQELYAISFIEKFLLVTFWHFYGVLGLELLQKNIVCNG